MRNSAFLWVLILGIFAVSLLPACGGDDGSPEGDGEKDAGITDDDDDTVESLSVISVTPSSGPLSGGVMVAIIGTGFEAGAKALFGGKEGTSTITVSDKKITTQTPPADVPGAVTVKVVLANGDSAELVNGFTYKEGGGDGKTYPVGWCILQYPPATESEASKPSEEIFGRVYAEGSTPGVGQGAGIIAQLGYGDPASNPEEEATNWHFGSAVYNLDVDGMSEGDLANDEYKGNLSVPNVGTYAYVYRFSGDGGAKWTYCDLDGSDNGFQADKMGVIAVKEGTTETVDWCILQYPPETTGVTGSQTELIYGRVYKAGVTEGGGKGANIVAELGYGPIATDPITNGEWKWLAADYNLDDGNNDEYMKALAINKAGEYNYAYRFTVTGSKNYLYCDLDGSDNGVQMENLGVLTVKAPEGPAPEIISLEPSSGETTGGTVVTIRGKNFLSGATVTFGTKQALEVSVDSPETITCKTPAHNAGYVSVTVRNPDGQTGTLEKGFNYIEPNPKVAWCNLQFPERLSAGIGEETSSIYGQVYHPGVTEGSGRGSGISAQLGVAQKNGAVSPELNPPSWQWKTAYYNVDSGNNDEYSAAITTTTAGEYYYAYRFSIDGGVTWRYCDLDGSDNGFALDKSGILTVSAAPPSPPTISSVTPSTGDISGGDTVTLAGTNFQSGAKLFFGSKPVTQMTFVSSTELTAVTPSSPKGKVDVTVQNPDGGSATKKQAFEYLDTKPKVDVAWIQYPFEISVLVNAETEFIFGRVYEPGLSDLTGEQKTIVAELGYGPRDSNPDGNSEWLWKKATFNREYGNDDEYMATLTVSSEGDYDYAFRFSIDAENSWYYADANPSESVYDPAKAGKLTVVTTQSSPAPVVSSITPAKGDVSGGTQVTIAGSNFQAGATVTFDGIAASDVVFGSASAITSVTPPHSAGKVAVTVKNPDNQSGSLPNGFEYTEVENLPDWCNLQYPAVTSAYVNKESENIYGQVYEPGVTNASGQAPGAGIVAELGWGAKGSDPRDEQSGWSWKNAQYNTDVGNNDEFFAKLTIASPGQYAYTFRYSLNGSSWVYGDLTGSNDGFSKDSLGSITVSVPLVDWCSLESPVSIEVEEGGETAEIYGQVYEAGVTDGSGQGAGVKAEVGYGGDRTLPGSLWQWFEASYVGKSGIENHNDRYAKKLTVNAAGVYDYAYRFSLDGGASWTYCDLDGSGNGYAVEQGGNLTVNPKLAIRIDSVSPSEGIAGGGTVVTITGAKFEAGVTVKFGELNATDVTIVSPTELTAKTPAASAGLSDVTVKLGSETATLEDGFAFTATTNANISWCKLQHPPSTATQKGVASEPIYGRVYRAGITEGAGQGAGIIAQVGYGPLGRNPTTNDNGWFWLNAIYNVDDGNNDEYKQAITVSEAGGYSYAYRFSDDGISFSYCDLNDLTQGGFTADQMGELTVSE